MNIDKLEIKDSNCNQCKLGVYCKNKCQVNILSSSKSLMIIGSHPDDYNESKDSVFQGESHKSLHQVLDKVLNIDQSQIHFTYLVKCNPKDKEPTNKNIKTCVEYLKEEIKFIQPKSILVLGGFAAKSLFGFSEELSIQDMNNSNQTITINEQEIPVKFSYSSQYINHNSYHLKQFVKDIYSAYAIATDAKSSEVPTKVKIVTTIIVS